MLLADHSLWHSWGETVLWFAAVVTALGVISRTKPVKWVWAQLVTKPVTTWGTNVVSGVVDAKVTSPIIGGSLRDNMDQMAGNQEEMKKALANIHSCLDRRFTDTHARMEKLTAYAEEVLAEAIGSRQRIRHLYRTLDAPVFETDSEGRCTYINPAYSKLAGLAGEEALGEGWMVAVHPDDRGRVLTEWREALSGGRKESTVLFRVQNAVTGEVTQVRGTASPLHDAMENVVGWVGMVEPLTLWDTLEKDSQEVPHE